MEHGTVSWQVKPGAQLLQLAGSQQPSQAAHLRAPQHARQRAAARPPVYGNQSPSESAHNRAVHLPTCGIVLDRWQLLLLAPPLGAGGGTVAPQLGRLRLPLLRGRTPCCCTAVCRRLHTILLLPRLLLLQQRTVLLQRRWCRRAAVAGSALQQPEPQRRALESLARCMAKFPQAAGATGERAGAGPATTSPAAPRSPVFGRFCCIVRSAAAASGGPGGQPAGPGCAAAGWQPGS